MERFSIKGWNNRHKRRERRQRRKKNAKTRKKEDSGRRRRMKRGEWQKLRENANGGQKNGGKK